MSEATVEIGPSTEPVEDLRRAAEAGDAEATTRLALRLLAGRDAPFAPEEGVSFLESGVERGDTDALCALAALRAVISGEKYILSQWIHNQPFAA